MRTRTRARLCRAVALAGVLAPAVGCAGTDGTPVRDAQTVMNEVSTQSSTILGLTQVKGKTNGGGTTEVNCDYYNDDDPNREVMNMWSLSGPDNATLAKGMANLAAGLPQHGWKVVSNGPDTSRARNQEILAVHLATKTQLDATWAKDLDAGDPQISFAVTSPCFRTPDRDGGGDGDGGGGGGGS